MSMLLKVHPTETTAALTDAGQVSNLCLVRNMLFLWWGV